MKLLVLKNAASNYVHIIHTSTNIEPIFSRIIGKPSKISARTHKNNTKFSMFAFNEFAVH